MVNTREIQLTRGFAAIVDATDYESLSKFKWSVLKGTNTYYAVRSLRINGKATKRYMHIEIMKPANGKMIDHSDRNGLNNQKINLRYCNRSQNGCNKIGHGAVKYLGVSKHLHKFRAQIHVNGKRKHLGLFNSAEEAAVEYNTAAKFHHKEFANLNVI